MSVMTHLWVSPRGRHTKVSNHTAWVAQKFGTTLPPEDDPAFKAEENRLYAMAYGANLMRVLADHGRHEMYVDNLVTGDHYRWIAREGARGHYRILDTDGKEIADFQPGKKRKRQEEGTLARRVALAAGAAVYIREALDIKDFILKQPIFNIFQSGDRWAVAVREAVPKRKQKGLLRGAKEWTPILAYIKPDTDGWALTTITDSALMRNSPMTIWDEHWPTKEAAAEAIWKARTQVQQATESIKDWIMNLKEPRARDVVYQVHALGQVYPFASFQKAHAHAMVVNQYEYTPTSIVKLHKKTKTPLMRWNVTRNGGLTIAEGMDHKKEMLRLLVPEETLASLGYREIAHTGYKIWVKGPIPLAKPFQTTQNYSDEEREWNDVFTWESATIRCDVGDHGWYVGLMLNGSLEGSKNPQTSELFMVDVRAPAHPNRPDNVSDEQWPIYGGYDFATPLIMATKMMEEQIPLLDENNFGGSARIQMRDSIYNTLRSKLPDFYHEAVDVKKFITGAEDAKYRIRKMLRPTRDHRGNRAEGLPPVEYWLRVVDYAEPKPNVFAWHTDKNSGTVFTAAEAERMLALMGGGYDMVQEAIDARDFIMKNPGELLIYVNEYVVNTRDDRETRPLRVWIGSEFQDEAAARRTAVNVARLAVQNPNREIVRVEMEVWDVPATFEAGDAKLLRTYLVKPDGTFEQIARPSDPTRVDVAGGGN